MPSFELELAPELSPRSNNPTWTGDDDDFGGPDSTRKLASMKARSHRCHACSAHAARGLPRSHLAGLRYRKMERALRRIWTIASTTGGTQSSPRRQRSKPPPPRPYEQLLTNGTAPRGRV